MWSSDKDSLINLLMLFDINGIKPNYAALARKYDMDYRTVKKYHEGYEGKPKSRDKPSKLDNYLDIIKTKLEIPRTTMKAVYEFLVSTYGLEKIGSYSNFKSYCKTKQLIPKGRVTSTPRYETNPGELAQVDWKENIKLTSKNGEVFKVNIFHMVLKFSRFSYLELTVSKERSTVFRCIINGFKFFGGVPKKLLFDNMSSIVSTNTKPKKISESFLQFSKDLNFEAQLCGFRKPETKGTNEARNKILDWIRPYDNEFEDYNNLVEITAEINRKMNIEICQGTNMPPSVLFFKEKEYLNPIACKEVIESYLTQAKVQVDSSQLIYYKGSKYSVDQSFIHKYVSLEELDGKLYIYYKGKCIQVHEISDNPINYSKDNYRQALSNATFDNKDIEELIDNNLKIMDSLLEKREITITRKEAVNSKESMITYFLYKSKGISNYVNSYIKSLDDRKEEEFYQAVKKLLPYIDDEYDLMNNFKFLVKNKNIKDICLNAWLEDYIYDTSILTEEGYEKIHKEYKKQINKYIEEEKNNDNNSTIK